jgi:hypothetical protein
MCAQEKTVAHLTEGAARTELDHTVAAGQHYQGGTWVCRRAEEHALNATIFQR